MANEPWSLGEKQDDGSRARLATVLYTAAEALRIVTALAHPVIPDATTKIWAQIGLGDIKKVALNELAWGQLRLGTKLGAVQPVFPRAWQPRRCRGRCSRKRRRNPQPWLFLRRLRWLRTARFPSMILPR